LPAVVSNGWKMLGQYTIFQALRLFRYWRFSFCVILRRVRQSFRPHYRAVIKSRPLHAGTAYFKLRICPTRSKKIFSQGRTSRPGPNECDLSSKSGTTALRDTFQLSSLLPIELPHLCRWVVFDTVFAVTQDYGCIKRNDACRQLLAGFDIII
jgi:hypothetical protein